MTGTARTTAIIADDEPRLAEYLRERLAALWPELVIVGRRGATAREAQALLDARSAGHRVPRHPHARA